MSRLQRLCALLLGAVFVAAAWAKVADPPGFAQALFHYHLLPEVLRHGFALVLPWLELLTGALLIIGGLSNRAVPGAARWAGLLLLVFAGALGINLLRGNPVDCGCFGLSAPKSAEAVLADMRWALLRDLGLMALCLPLWRRSLTR